MKQIKMALSGLMIAGAWAAPAMAENANHHTPHGHDHAGHEEPANAGNASLAILAPDGTLVKSLDQALAPVIDELLGKGATSNLTSIPHRVVRTIEGAVFEEVPQALHSNINATLDEQGEVHISHPAGNGSPQILDEAGAHPPIGGQADAKEVLQ